MKKRSETTNKLDANRRDIISALASAVVELYSPQPGPTNLEQIIKALGLGYSLNDYDGYFDGMLTYDGDKFCIHVDDSLNKHHARHRFTVAHELGHFFIDEHRWALMSGIPPHYAKHTGFATHSVVEQEADLFAGCLLAPEARLRRDYLNIREFTPKVIHDFARRYKCSYPTMVSRFIDLSLHPLMRLTIRDNEIESFFRSEGFRYWPRDRRKVPEDSYLFDILQGEGRCDIVHQGYVADWFNPRYGEDGETELFEYYRQWGDTFYGLIWEG